MYSDDDAAALYDLLNPWDPARSPDNAFYDELVLAAPTVLDVGCGTGAMLHRAREQGHTGRLVGLDPDRPSLARARRRSDIEWVDGRAADAAWSGEFDLATMTSHAFQCLVGDEELRASLAAIRAALRPGGRFAFETRHPQARAWLEWNPANAVELTDGAGRALRIWHEVESADDAVVTFNSTTAAPDGTVLHRDRSSLRFLAPEALDYLLAEAGFTVEARYGDWHRGPVTATSREIVTVAVRA
ncbi:class I SAM-dependent methyltransferase [Kitasatospora sp. NBC_01287]|uniref:class I SAM-dependent methyltransferase n=1 Tax=Kitasatospora sp. NBC_01287 TaxID=2903573 RepID=UPI00224DB9FB|nr:class I SAM-dependent methyltransferase [Kitasatospora sp. NBC_01287]MCX4750735.1 class I SAM-dependent methyltransferase [Kitasatospora sp. NBC_01287]